MNKFNFIKFDSSCIRESILNCFNLNNNFIIDTIFIEITMNNFIIKDLVVKKKIKFCLVAIFRSMRRYNEKINL